MASYGNEAERDIFRWVRIRIYCFFLVDTGIEPAI